MFWTITWSDQIIAKYLPHYLRHSFKNLQFGSPYFISCSNLLHTPAINRRNEGNHEQLFLFGWQPWTKHTELLIASKHICIFIQTRWWMVHLLLSLWNTFSTNIFNPGSIHRRPISHASSPNTSLLQDAFSLCLIFFCIFCFWF